MSRSTAELLSDIVAHRYFDTTHSIVAETVRRDVPLVRTAAARLLNGHD